MTEQYLVNPANKRIRIVTVLTLDSNEASFKSPIIQTPHDSQTLDEFKGIFAPPAVYSPLKLHIDYQRSPVQRVLNPLPTNFMPVGMTSMTMGTMAIGNSNKSGNIMWWMDENEERDGESWLKEVDNTEDDKKRFFAALEKNEITDFSDDDADDDELIHSINDLNSQIDQLTTEYTQDERQVHDTRDVSLSFDGESFIETSISSVREELDSGQVTPRYPNSRKVQLDGPSFNNGQVATEDNILQTDQLKSDLQGNVLGDFESDEESREINKSVLETLDNENQDVQKEVLEEKKGNVSISFASFEESTILLEDESKEHFQENDSIAILNQEDKSLQENIPTLEEPEDASKSEDPVVDKVASEPEDASKSEDPVVDKVVSEPEDASMSEDPVVDKVVSEPEDASMSEDPVVDKVASEPEDVSVVVEVTSTELNNDTVSQKSTTSTKGIKVDREELLKLKSIINDLEFQVKELEQDLFRKENENETLKKESVLLESILAKEQANSKRLLSRMGGNNQADLIQLRKEVEDQERLIHGYQLENERLIDQNKDLKMQLKESEKKELLKSEKLSREITALKTQLSERERFQTRSELGVATYQLQIETLEQELHSLRSSALETSESQKAEIEKLNAMLKEAKKSKLKPDVAENAKESSSKEFLEMKDQYDAQILELEQKLKWHTENQEMIEDLKKNIALKDARIKNLEESMDFNSPSKKDLRRRSLVDIQKINTLEAEIKKLKETGSKSRSNAALKAEKLVEEKNDDVIRLLEAKISTLNEENDQLSRDAEVRIRSLQQEYNSLRIQYEKNMDEMEQKVLEFENNDDKALKSRITELSVALEEKENQLKMASESNVRKRVLELEQLLDEQSNIYMALLKEKSDLKEQMIKITREREKLIDSYEAQVDGMEKALRDKIFAVEETKHLDEINDLRLKREADLREILDLKTRLEISEKTRSSVQETTLVILKQAQEESAKLAMAHHERSLKSFLSEIRAETGQKSRQDEDLEAQLSEALLTIEKLQKTNFDLECSNASLSDQVKSLSAELVSLQKANSSLEIMINESKTSWPPSQQTFEGLKERIRELEAASNKRESDIILLLEESRISASKELAQEKRDLLKILSRKDAEIISFKQELESLMGMIVRLKNEKF